MSMNAQRNALLDTGLRLVHERGFAATGVREIAAAAGVPQGSFTNHFRSKEAFGVLLLNRYVERLEMLMDATLRDVGRPPRERLRAYFDEIERLLAGAGWRTGCLVPDLAGEVPVHSETLRRRLCDVIERQTAAFEVALHGLLGADKAGDGARDLAAFILAAWHGTLLRMKVEQNPTALLAFRRVLDCPSLDEGRAQKSDVGGN